MYCKGGMLVETALSSAGVLKLPVHSEKLRCARPAAMSCWASHENGAMSTAHQYLVWLLWQS